MTEPVRVKISFLSDKEVTLVENDGNLLRYKRGSVTLHPKMEKGDFVDLVKDGESTTLIYPPGMEPDGLSKVEIHEQFRKEAVEKKELQWQIVLINQNQLIVKKGPDDKETNFKFKEPFRNLKWFKPGDLVKVKIVSENTIETVWHVDENGNSTAKKNFNGGASGNVEIAAWVETCKDIGIIATDKGWTDEKAGECLNLITRLYNAVIPEVKKEVRN